MDDQLTDFNYSIGKFVTAPGVPVGMLGGMFDDVNTYIMLLDGYVARRPIAWCRYVPPPVDPDCTFPLRSAVIVANGRLQGMLGTVAGSMEGRVFLQALRGSHPTNLSDMYGIEMIVFVEDEDYLLPWRMYPHSPGSYDNGYYVPSRL